MTRKVLKLIFSLGAVEPTVALSSRGRHELWNDVAVRRNPSITLNCLQDIARDDRLATISTTG